MSLKAIVKSVQSGDTLVLRGRAGPQGQPPKERILHIAEISAPRLGNAQKDDEPYAFESRDFLRALVVGKEVTFTSTFSLPPSEGTPRDIGNAQVHGVDLADQILTAGWAKVKESKRDDLDAERAHRELESQAQVAGKGIWNVAEKKSRTVYHTMPVDAQGFINGWKGKIIDALVETVRDGSTMRVRLMLPNDVHQIINLSLAGVRSPKAGGREGEMAEPWGEEAKFFTESRIGQRVVKVQLLALPSPSGVPFQTLTAVAPTATTIIGVVLHPAGNIAEHLVAAGLARVVDWHAGMLAPTGGMEKLRVAERVAKEKRLGFYALLSESTPPYEAINGSHPPGGKSTFDAQVVRIWSSDQLSVIEKGTTNERRLQLSSVRAPKAENASFAGEAKEFLRKKLIGKHVRVKIDFIRPAEGEFEARECATIHYGNANANVAEQLIEKGLATAFRHKKDDENRSSEYDKYMAAEQAAVAESRGMHSGKPTSPARIGNASESSAKAAQFLNSFKRTGRLSAQVLNVATGSRFKLLIPKENQTLTFVLVGIRTPRPPRAAFGEKGSEKDKTLDKGEPWGQEALDFALRKLMQRDVEVEFDSIDKSGGFVGIMFHNKENVALELVKNGFAMVHSYSADSLSWARQLYDAESQAKVARLNVWSDFEDEGSKPAEASIAPKLEYFDVIVSDVRPSTDFAFSIQVLNNNGIESLERLMHEFSLFHRTAPAVAGFTPRSGELVSARFSGDGNWYRAKARRISPAKKEAELTFIDYGNQEIVSFTNIRPLDEKFRSLPGQAQDARLSFVRLIGPESEYHEEAVHRFQLLCADKKLIANIDYTDGGIPFLRLIDPNDSTVATDLNASINVDLVREGFAIVESKNKHALSYPSLMAKLREATDVAKRERAGIYEFGDVSPDDY